MSLNWDAILAHFINTCLLVGGLNLFQVFYVFFISLMLQKTIIIFLRFHDLSYLIFFMTMLIDNFLRMSIHNFSASLLMDVALLVIFETRLIYNKIT